MSLHKDKTFRRYLEKCDDKFSVINCITEVARARSKSHSNSITDSQALTWVVQNKEPDTKEVYHIIDLTCENSIIDDTLELIDDENIKEAVISSIHMSKKQGHLIYDYKLVKDANIKRVRVLTNIIWHKISR